MPGLYELNKSLYESMPGLYELNKSLYESIPVYTSLEIRAVYQVINININAGGLCIQVLHRLNTGLLGTEYKSKLVGCKCYMGSLPGSIRD